MKKLVISLFSACLLALLLPLGATEAQAALTVSSALYYNNTDGQLHLDKIDGAVFPSQESCEYSGNSSTLTIKSLDVDVESYAGALIVPSGTTINLEGYARLQAKDGGIMSMGGDVTITGNNSLEIIDKGQNTLFPLPSIFCRDLTIKDSDVTINHLDGGSYATGISVRNLTVGGEAKLNVTTPDQGSKSVAVDALQNVRLEDQADVTLTAGNAPNDKGNAILINHGNLEVNGTSRDDGVTLRAYLTGNNENKAIHLEEGNVSLKDATVLVGDAMTTSAGYGIVADVGTISIEDCLMSSMVSNGFTLRGQGITLNDASLDLTAFGKDHDNIFSDKTISVSGGNLLLVGGYSGLSANGQISISNKATVSALPLTNQEAEMRNGIRKESTSSTDPIVIEDSIVQATGGPGADHFGICNENGDVIISGDTTEVTAQGGDKAIKGNLKAEGAVIKAGDDENGTDSTYNGQKWAKITFGDEAVTPKPEDKTPGGETPEDKTPKPPAGKEGVKELILRIGYLDVYADGVLIPNDAKPYIADGRTMVPLRVITEAFGCDVKWDDKARTITVTHPDKVLVYTVDKKEYTVTPTGDKAKTETMDVPPMIQKETGRTFIPIRFVGTPFGYDASYTQTEKGLTDKVIFKKK